MLELPIVILVLQKKNGISQNVPQLQTGRIKIETPLYPPIFFTPPYFFLVQISGTISWGRCYGAVGLACLEYPSTTSQCWSKFCLLCFRSSFPQIQLWVIDSASHYWAPTPQLGDPAVVLWSLLGPGPALISVSIWGVIQQIENQPLHHLQSPLSLSAFLI